LGVCGETLEKMLKKGKFCWNIDGRRKNGRKLLRGGRGKVRKL